MIPTVLSLWNTFVENEGKRITDRCNKHPVILCRRLKVVTYNGNFNSQFTSILILLIADCLIHELMFLLSLEQEYHSQQGMIQSLLLIHLLEMQEC